MPAHCHCPESLERNVCCPLQAGAAAEQQPHVAGVGQGQREERAEDLDEEEAEGAAGSLPEAPGKPAGARTPAFLSDDGETSLSLHLHLCPFFPIHRILIFYLFPLLCLHRRQQTDIQWPTGGPEKKEKSTHLLMLSEYV